MQLFQAVKMEINKHMNQSRDLRMAAMTDYIKILQDVGHKSEIFTIDRRQMKFVIMAAGNFIHRQSKLAVPIPSDHVFDEGSVNFSDIKDGQKYYSGFKLFYRSHHTFVKRVG